MGQPLNMNAMSMLAASETLPILHTMVAAIGGGIFLMILAHRLRISAIVMLLLGGVVLGPQGFGIVQPEKLGQDVLLVIVSLAVGLILFEGGLTLNREGYRAASGVILRLLTVGVLVTWFVTAAAVHWIGGVDARLAMLAGSMVIVTGPTVIAPILKRIRIHPRLNHILHWESVLIDPIGVFVAILWFEWLSGQGSGALAGFGGRVFIGMLIGVVGGLLIDAAIRFRVIPEDMTNVFALASAVLVFGAAESFYTEAGLLAVTVSGFVLGLRNPIEVKQIKRFKSELTELSIAVLFILLAARLEIEQFKAFGWTGVLLLLVVLFVVRPANVFVSSLGFKLNWREKAFLSWMAPRGIVAASMASLFSLRLVEMDYPNAKFIETFTYSVIAATVILQGFTAGPLASLLNLKAATPTGWLIVGAHALGRRVANFLQKKAERTVILLDSNGKAVSEARREGMTAFVGDARDESIQEREEMQPIGNLLALTDNVDLNLLLCQRWEETLGRDHVFLWSPATQKLEADHAGRVIWSKLPRPSLISGELARGETAVLERDMLRRGWSNLGTPILTFIGGQEEFGPNDVPETESDAKSPTLYLRREADYLSRSLRSELVVKIAVKDQAELFGELVKRIVDFHPTVNRERTIEELLERERSFPTTLGHGVAIPHAYANELDMRVCAVAQLEQPIPFGAADGQDVHLAFLLLSPKGDPEGHLATVAEIARLVSDEEIRKKILAIDDPEQLFLLLRGLQNR